MNKITKKIQKDVIILLFDIIHQMEILERQTINLENIMYNTQELEQYYNEETLNELIYHYDAALKAYSFLDEIESDCYNDMDRLSEAIENYLKEVEI